VGDFDTIFEKVGRTPDPARFIKRSVARKVVSFANHLARIWLALLRIACSASLASLRIAVMVTYL